MRSYLVVVVLCAAQVLVSAMQADMDKIIQSLYSKHADVVKEKAIRKAMGPLLNNTSESVTSMTLESSGNEPIMPLAMAQMDSETLAEVRRQLIHRNPHISLETICSILPDSSQPFVYIYKPI